jgi:hypothetical protein
MKDGGPAFPQPPCPDCGTQHAPEHVPGMSLRDYFAAKALNGMLASDSSVDRTKVNKAKWAEVAYEFADAMLKAREQA